MEEERNYNAVTCHLDAIQVAISIIQKIEHLVDTLPANSVSTLLERYKISSYLSSIQIYSMSFSSSRKRRLSFSRTSREDLPSNSSKEENPGNFLMLYHEVSYYKPCRTPEHSTLQKFYLP